MKKIIFVAMLLAINYSVLAQDKKVIRMARITIDSSQTEAYRKLLKTQMEAAVRIEPGVLSYTVYEDKTAPAKLTILEVYADSNAYLAHRETPHFKQYKSATKDMVKSLELSALNPVFSLKKKEDF
ncbi:putative quinol monooxygenase [Ferruginibacter paludis]|uniref:putative quinol monooxygenase n=1 Tax=Ferruginibacter paludis TaxID=1310417 RepID=UPI0025B3B816|nr:putative quinol monooxygenase [Ferruginibacter paludis]MDN3656604.1 putative quinol monooxygenase [Ferruginibacter paludis]